MQTVVEQEPDKTGDRSTVKTCLSGKYRQSTSTRRLELSRILIECKTVIETEQKPHGKINSIHVVFAFQRSRFACGSVAEAWRSFRAAESATSLENNIHTPSLEVAGLCLQGTHTDRQRDTSVCVPVRA